MERPYLQVPARAHDGWLESCTARAEVSCPDYNRQELFSALPGDVQPIANAAFPQALLAPIAGVPPEAR